MKNMLPRLFFVVMGSALCLFARTRLCDSLYNEGEYDSALVCYHSLDPVQGGQALVLERLGILYYVKNSRDMAEVFFDSLLRLKPDYELDPLYVAPEIIESFQLVKRRYAAGKPDAEAAAPVQAAPGPAALRPVHFIPYGLGHILDHRVKRGGMYMFLSAAALTCNIVSYKQRHTLRTDASGAYYEPDKAFRLYRNQIITFYGIFAPLGVISLVDCVFFRKQRDAHTGIKVKQ